METRFGMNSRRMNSMWRSWWSSTEQG